MPVSASSGAQELHDPEVVGEQQADQAHRAQVVDDGQRQQEDPQVRRQLRPRDGQRGDGEGDVGGDRRRPARAARRPAAGMLIAR